MNNNNHSLKRIYVVVNRDGEVVAHEEEAIELREWRVYLEDKESVQPVSKRVDKFLKQWNKKDNCVIHVGIAHSLPEFLQAMPEIRVTA